ncbi:Pol protein [Phytophthora palmivora]|uniref:Pol protein n=1 Tax=Phytophthora palmivora TaxID=4796 RepID=A0A2P4YN07_9STRA|nr:Pol protein [Phytophthora palmivora]
MVRRSASITCSKILFAVSVRKHLGPGRTSFLWLGLHQQCGTTGFTQFYSNHLRHPLVLLTLRGDIDASIVSGGEARKAFSSQVSEIEPVSLKRQLASFLDDRLTLIIRVRDAMASAQDRQTEYSDKRKSNKLNHRFIGPFAVLARHDAAYTIDLPTSMATHPTFDYHGPLGPSPRTEEGQGEISPPQIEVEPSGQPKLPVSEPVNEAQAGTPANHTKGYGGTEWEELV